VLYEPRCIAGRSATEHWGLTEHLSRSIFAATAATIRERSQRVLDLQRRTTGVIRLDPGNPAHGRLTKRWGLWVNVHLDVSVGGA
jgi:predicted transcriptional regulator of viral defense system